jgi:hypothetical protein
MRPLVDPPRDGETEAGRGLGVDADRAGRQQAIDPAVRDAEPGGDQPRGPHGQRVEELDLDRRRRLPLGRQRLGAQLPGPLEVEREVVAPAERRGGDGRLDERGVVAQIAVERRRGRSSGPSPVRARWP